MRPIVLAGAASLSCVTCAAGFVAAALTAGTQLSQGALAQGPVWPLVLIAAGVGAVLALRLLVCALAIALALMLERGEPSAPRRAGARGAARRVALTASPRLLRPTLAAVLAGGVTLVIAAPATAAPVSVTVTVTRPTSSTTPSASPTTSPITSGTASTTSASTSATASPPATDTGPTAPEGQLPAPGWHQLGSDGWRPSPRPQPRAASARPVTGPELVTSGSRGCAPAAELVVRRGDTLWHLAARALGPGASAAEIAAEWPRWWAVNRERVGDDPDLILPGTRLCAPPSPTAGPHTTKELR